ncbi:Flp pilus assembly protein, ATPase CpaF [Zymobacter palmae]|uniref:Flp pilus assembly protein, ATPase CpaF n=1 Tax=Zymobacter palmae TaxID=33074 RepID=A0A348HE33_9GAMM|nr:Flp pilus assembly protein, ATPase CpaF [Zymobacter palmae]
MPDTPADEEPCPLAASTLTQRALPAASVQDGATVADTLNANTSTLPMMPHASRFIPFSLLSK